MTAPRLVRVAAALAFASVTLPRPAAAAAMVESLPVDFLLLSYHNVEAGRLGTLVTTRAGGTDPFYRFGGFDRRLGAFEDARLVLDSRVTEQWGALVGGVSGSVWFNTSLSLLPGRADSCRSPGRRATPPALGD